MQEELPFAIKLREFPSLSQPGHHHHVHLDSDGRVGCTCSGWTFHRHCWHVDQILGEELTSWLTLRGVKVVGMGTQGWKFERVD